jgi:hypothetical protein
MLRQGTPIGHPASNEDILDEKVGQLKKQL